MKKKAILALAILATSLLLASCQCVPEHVNLTGDWDFNYGDYLQNNGTMTLHQNGAVLTGNGSSLNNKFDITGSVKGASVVIEGKGENSTFTSNARLVSENSFRGSFNSTGGTSGSIEARRMK